MLRRIAHATKRALGALERPAKGPNFRRPPGIALVIALVTIAILSAAVVEYAYSSRVNLSMAVNSKDKVKSYYQARSAVNLSWLLINFQYQLLNEADKAGDSGNSEASVISTAMRRSNFQMYQYIEMLMEPFNSGSLQSPVGGIDLQESGVQGFGETSGSFSVDVTPETGRFNVNEFARTEVGQDQLFDLCSMVMGSEYDALFEQDDQNDQIMDRARVLENIIDFIDLNEQGVKLEGNCEIRGQSGDENEGYEETEIEPRNAKLTHLEEMHQIHGVSEAFMRAFKDQMTVYPVGKPNANVAQAPVFYSMLCRHVQLPDGQELSDDGGQLSNACSSNQQIGQQVLYFALALDGVRSFFEDPLSVLMAYVGSTQSKLLPSAKKGQPVAFLSTSQVYSYIEDFQRNPQLMAQFMTYSPAYRQMATQMQGLQVNPQSPNFPQWTVGFSRSGLIRDFTTRTPSIYRIQATGTYGATETTIETVIDFEKTVRRLPEMEQLRNSAGVGESETEEAKQLENALDKRTETMPKGRVLYWRENINQTGDNNTSQRTTDPSAPGGGFGADAGTQGGASGEESSEDQPFGGQNPGQMPGMGNDNFGGGSNFGNSSGGSGFNFDE